MDPFWWRPDESDPKYTFGFKFSDLENLYIDYLQFCFRTPFSILELPWCDIIPDRCPIVIRVISLHETFRHWRIWICNAHKDWWGKNGSLKLSNQRGRSCGSCAPYLIDLKLCRNFISSYKNKSGSFSDEMNSPRIGDSFFSIDQTFNLKFQIKISSENVQYFSL